MTRRRDEAFTLEQALADPGFTPRRSDVPALLDRLGGEDPELAEQAMRALLRAGVPAARGAVLRADARTEGASPTARRRLTAFVGRAAARDPEDDLRAFLIRGLDDPDAKTRRNAAIALGKIHSPDVETALAEALGREASDGVRRSIVAALGKVGQERALEALDRVEAGGEAFAKERSRAALMVERTLARDAPSTFDPTRSAPGPTLAVLRCRAGLEGILRSEIDPDLAARIAREAPLGARVEVKLVGPPARLLKARTMLSVGFPLPARPIAGDADTLRALVESLVSPESRRILAHFTAGPVRYRIAWARGGKRRALVWQTALEVARHCPSLVNDPTSSTWQAVVYEAPGVIRVELVPRFDDTRFFYRRGDVPAASHPTIAAALVHVAGVRPDDVVWDPFVGSATELCERALAGPYRLLLGTDIDDNALTVARGNLNAVGASPVELYAHDVRRPVPFAARPTLIITNPPMGRRVHRAADLGSLLESVIGQAARVLEPGGRLVWVSPLPHRSAVAAAGTGLSPALRQDVDMGGFEAQIQVFTKRDGGHGARRRRP